MSGSITEVSLAHRYTPWSVLPTVAFRLWMPWALASDTVGPGTDHTFWNCPHWSFASRHGRHCVSSWWAELRLLPAGWISNCTGLSVFWQLRKWCHVLPPTWLTWPSLTGNSTSGGGRVSSGCGPSETVFKPFVLEPNWVFIIGWIVDKVKFHICILALESSYFSLRIFPERWGYGRSPDSLWCSICNLVPLYTDAYSLFGVHSPVHLKPHWLRTRQRQATVWSMTPSDTASYNKKCVWSHCLLLLDQSSQNSRDALGQEAIKCPSLRDFWKAAKDGGSLPREPTRNREQSVSPPDFWEGERTGGWTRHRQPMISSAAAL